MVTSKFLSRLEMVYLMLDKDNSRLKHGRKRRLELSLLALFLSLLLCVWFEG